MKTKLIGTLIIVFGVFLFAGGVFASSADVLQPAGATTYLESLRVGIAGQGGVTFFNGTVLNEGYEAFTVGDDLRVDGDIFRIQRSGDPLKISDNVIPSLRYSYSLGSRDYYWERGYFGATVQQNILVGTINLVEDSFSATPAKTGDIMNYGGNIHIRTLTSNGKIYLSTSDGVEIYPRLKLSNRTNQAVPDCDLTRKGEIYFDSDTNHFYGCIGSSWKQLDN